MSGVGSQTCQERCPKLCPFAAHFLFRMHRNRDHKELGLFFIWFSWCLSFSYFWESHGCEQYFTVFFTVREKEAQAWRSRPWTLLQSQAGSESGWPWRTVGRGQLLLGSSKCSCRNMGLSPRVVRSPWFWREARNPDSCMKFPEEICSKLKKKNKKPVWASNLHSRTCLKMS